MKQHFQFIFVMFLSIYEIQDDDLLASSVATGRRPAAEETNHMVEFIDNTHLIISHACDRGQVSRAGLHCRSFCDHKSTIGILHR